MTFAPFTEPEVRFEAEIGTRSVSNIYCIGRNYADHAKELGNETPKTEPVVFLKSRSSLRGLAPEPVAFAGETFHHEIELVLYVGRDVFIGQKAGWDMIDGVALGIDLTRRDIQAELKAKGLPWTTAKSFAGSAVVGPFVSKELWRGQDSFSFKLAVNGTERQAGDSQHMIFDVPSLLTYLASFQALRSGDLIFTGTPAGVAGMKVGDTFTLDLTHPQRRWDGKL